MAHYIAELMAKVDPADTPEAREAAESRCAEAIQTLWSRRERWPYGAPLQRISGVLNALAGTPERHEPERPEPTGGWMGALGEIERLGEEEHEVARQAAIAQLDLADEKALLDAGEGELFGEDLDAIKRLVELQERQAQPYFRLGPLRVEGFGDLEVEERERRIEEALSDIARRRAVVLSRARGDEPEVSVASP